ncbi:FAD-dependent oxidoreductase [Nonomuraea thailandensis]
MPAKGAQVDVIVGGGVVGLSVAWRTARAGRAVTVVDPAPGRGPRTRRRGCWPRSVR